MKYDEFVAQVQRRAQLPSGGAAVRAIHATLETLGERLFLGEEEQLASQLPAEIGFYLTVSPDKDTFGIDEFFDRIAMREGVHLGDAMLHARVVLSVLAEAASAGQIKHVRAQLPPDMDWLLGMHYDRSAV